MTITRQLSLGLLAWVLWVQAVGLPEDNPQLKKVYVSSWQHSITLDTERECEIKRTEYAESKKEVLKDDLVIKMRYRCVKETERP